jgi:hypothetical protein
MTRPSEPIRKSAGNPRCPPVGCKLVTGLWARKDDNLTDTGVGDFIVSTHDRLEMNVADGAAGETPKLQVDESIGVGNRDRVARNTD